MMKMIYLGLQAPLFGADLQTGSSFSTPLRFTFMISRVSSLTNIGEAIGERSKDLNGKPDPLVTNLQCVALGVLSNIPSLSDTEAQEAARAKAEAEADARVAIAKEVAKEKTKTNADQQ